MASLWGDGWFYISALGFLGSGALFLYLLGQYRSAVEEAEESDTDAPSLESTSGGPLPAISYFLSLQFVHRHIPGVMRHGAPLAEP